LSKTNIFLSRFVCVILNSFPIRPRELSDLMGLRMNNYHGSSIVLKLNFNQPVTNLRNHESKVRKIQFRIVELISHWWV